MFINPDLTVHLWREPVGEWIGSDAVTRTSDTGIGMAETALWDRGGRVGRGTAVAAARPHLSPPAPAGRRPVVQPPVVVVRRRRRARR